MLIILPLVAFFTAMLSAIIGMGGGILLLATMFCFLTHAEAIPAHGAVQLISNSTRTLAYLKHVDWQAMARFAIGALPGSILGVVLLICLAELKATEPYLKIIVGLYVLIAPFVPKNTGAHAGTSGWEFPLFGFFAGAAAFTVGAVGPLIAPLFARANFVKERLVATKAICQSILHLAKIPVFLALRDFEDLGQLSLITLLMAVLVIPGTFAGKRMLRHVSEQRFVWLYRAALLVAGAKVLLIDGLWPLFQPA